MGLEAPQIVMIVGIALVLAGLAWQIYRDLHSGSVASGSAVAESQPVVRRLSLPQKDLVAEQLKKHGWEPDTVWIRFESGCSECQRYASDFADAFTKAGWSDRISTTLDERHDLAGVLLSVADLNAQTQTARLLASTLREAGIHFQMVPWPELSPERTILWVHQPKI
jgi:hypothetical protein